MIRFLSRLVISALMMGAGVFLWSTCFSSTSQPGTAATAAAISDILANPSLFDGKVVEIVGVPVPNARIVALGFGGIVFSIEAGQKLAVLVKTGVPATRPGERLHFVGVLRNVLDVGSIAIPILISE